MDWGNNSFDFANVERELRESGDDALLRMCARLDEGDLEALEFVGAAYLRGSNGLRADFDKAFTFLQIAANAGSTEALLHLGDCYAYGIGVAADAATARSYYRLAAQSPQASVRETALRQLKRLDENE